MNGEALECEPGEAPRLLRESRIEDRRWKGDHANAEPSILHLPSSILDLLFRILRGLSGLSDKLENALFEAGCNEALLGTYDGVVYLDFDREATSFIRAVDSAIRDVNKAGYQVAAIESDEEVMVNRS